MKKSFKDIYLITTIILLVAVIALIAVFFVQHSNIKQNEQYIKEITDEMEFEKQQSLEEFEKIALEYENFNIVTNNDSLLKLIDEEKQKVQNLLQELKTVKATNARRIAELKKELGTVRGVLKSYVEKVDSLNTINTNLKKENTKVKIQYEETAKQLKELTEQAEKLDEKITLASILEAGNIEIKPLNNKGNVTNSLRKIKNIEICFNILRNITAERGKKTVYLRLTGPGESLFTNNTSGVFEFEGSEIEFSCKKDIEYGGENLSVCIYYPITTTLEKGSYNVDIFTEGNWIGSKSFSFK